MKNIFLAVIFIFLLLSPVCRAAAQSSTDTQTFDTTGFPQWVKDMRRFDIIAFGVFPFAYLFSNFAYDMNRWTKANGRDMSAEGRRYAPWPLRSAGAVEKSKKEFGQTLLIAGGVSMAFAVADLIIVIVKRSRDRKRIESLPSGSIEINTMMYDQDEVDAVYSVETSNLNDVFNLIKEIDAADLANVVNVFDIINTAVAAGLNNADFMEADNEDADGLRSDLE